MKPTHHHVPFAARPEPGGFLTSIVRTWDRFWFRPADPLPLGVMRIFAGVVILYIHLIFSLDLQALVGKEAWLDKEPLEFLRKKAQFYPPTTDWNDGGQFQKPIAEGMPLWSVWFHVEDPGWVVAVHVCFLVAMFLFTIGFATRVTGVITWMAVIGSFSARARSCHIFGSWCSTATRAAERR